MDLIASCPKSAQARTVQFLLGEVQVLRQPRRHRRCLFQGRGQAGEPLQQTPASAADEQDSAGLLHLVPPPAITPAPVACARRGGGRRGGGRRRAAAPPGRRRRPRRKAAISIAEVLLPVRFPTPCLVFVLVPKNNTNCSVYMK